MDWQHELYLSKDEPLGVRTARVFELLKLLLSLGGKPSASSQLHKETEIHTKNVSSVQTRRQKCHVLTSEE